MDRSDSDLIKAVLAGDTASFEPLITRHQPRVFATVRRYARREDEVEDIVQEVFLKAFTRLASFRGESPFEHWLMRMTVRTCFDWLRGHQRNREHTFAEITEEEEQWIERHAVAPIQDTATASAARELIHKIMEQLSPTARLVITLLEIEERSLKEIAKITGWSIPVVKVRAFRARREMARLLKRIKKEKYL